MGSLLLTSSAAFAASLFLTAAVRAAARRWKIVDRPDGQRKLHGWPVPLCGGVVVYAAMILGLLAVRFGTSEVAPELRELSTAWMIAALQWMILTCVLPGSWTYYIPRCFQAD